MARGWFPKANTSDHYVFLTSLESDNPGLYAAAAEMLKVNGGLEVFAEEAHFENALAFLNSAANAERIKEINSVKFLINGEENEKFSEIYLKNN